MRVLIILNNSPAERYLIHLHRKTLIREVQNLINASRYSKAISTVFSKGVLVRVVCDDEVHSTEAALILTKNTASWDLVGN